MVMLLALGGFAGCNALLGIDDPTVRSTAVEDSGLGEETDGAGRDGRDPADATVGDAVVDAGAADAAIDAGCDGALAAGLIGYWPFDGNGSDVSGYERTMTLVGPTYEPGVRGQALAFTGDGTRYATRDTVDDDAFDFGAADFTIQIWAYFPTTKVDAVLVEKLQGSGAAGWSFMKQGVADDHIQWFWGAISNSPALTVVPTQWHHFVVRRSAGGVYKSFFDGVLATSATDPNPILDTAFPLLVGRRNASAGQAIYMNGRLDELAIWNRALADVEIGAVAAGACIK